MYWWWQACADKLKNEMEDFGFPPNFPVETEPATEGKEPANQSGGEIKDKAKGKKVRVNFVYIFE